MLGSGVGEFGTGRSGCGIGWFGEGCGENCFAWDDEKEGWLERVLLLWMLAMLHLDLRWRLGGCWC